MTSKDITYNDFKKIWGNSLSETKIKQMWEDTKANIVEKYNKGEKMSPEAKRLAIKSISDGSGSKTTTTGRSRTRSPRRSSPRRSARRSSPRRSPRKSPEKTTTTTLAPRSPSPIRSVRRSIPQSTKKMENEAPVKLVTEKGLALGFLFQLTPGKLFATLNASPGLVDIIPVAFWVKYYRNSFGRTLEFEKQESNDPDVWLKMTRAEYKRTMTNHFI